jgi:hypothetical protein
MARMIVVRVDGDEQDKVDAEGCVATALAELAGMESDFEDERD